MLKSVFRLVLLCVLAVQSMSCYSQIDSAFIKGELELEDGFYGADKVHYENPMFFASEDDSDYYFLNQELQMSLGLVSHTEYRLTDQGWHVLFIDFKKEVNKQWEHMTEELIYAAVVLIIDNKVVELRQVMGAIPNGLTVVGGPTWTKSDIFKLKKAIGK